MYKKILVPLDGSESAEAAIPLAVAICQATVGRLCLVHVDDPGPIGQAQLPSSEKYLDRAAESASNALNESVDTAVIQAREAHTSKSETAAHIAEYAGEHGYDLIVASTSGRSGLQRVFAGSVAEALLWVTPCPVLFCGPQSSGHVIREGPNPIRKLLIALDQTTLSEDILDEAVAFAKAMNAEVILVHVVQPMRAQATVMGMELSVFSPDEWKELNERADAYLARVTQQLAAAGVNAASEKVETNDIAGAILDVAERLSVDTIALASTAPHRLTRALFGSEADRLIRNAPCPVLVIRSAP
jgi:nucleotide-binding universal stress UspA family protein